LSIEIKDFWEIAQEWLKSDDGYDEDWCVEKGTTSEQIREFIRAIDKIGEDCGITGSATIFRVSMYSYAGFLELYTRKIEIMEKRLLCLKSDQYALLQCLH